MVEIVRLRVCSRRPLSVESRAIVERFLCPHTSGGKPGIEIRTSYGIALGQAFSQKHPKAADERIAGSGAVDTIHIEGGNVLHTIAAGQKRPLLPASQHHTANPPCQKFLSTLFCLFKISHWHSRNAFSLALIRNKIIQP